MVQTMVRPVSATLRTTLITMLAALASSPARVAQPYILCLTVAKL